MESLRIGVLGAARISEWPIVEQARVTGMRLVAVAARDRGRAESFASAHGFERVHASYADVTADPEVEAIYNPLANSLHAPWNKVAILAGKHVLTEKPFASNAVEAADRPRAGLVVDISHLERGPSTLADLATVPGEKVFVVELNDAADPRSDDLFNDTIHHRVRCGAGVLDVRGLITTLQQIGFAGPWGVEIISDVHRQRPLDQSLADVRRTTLDVFDSLTEIGS